MSCCSCKGSVLSTKQSNQTNLVPQAKPSEDYRGSGSVNPIAPDQHDGSRFAKAKGMYQPGGRHGGGSGSRFWGLDLLECKVLGCPQEETVQEAGISIQV